MTTSIPGAPVNPPRGRTAQFMFLGGPLDHAVRQLEVDGAFSVPAETYTLPARVKPVWDYVSRITMPETPKAEVYNRHRVTDGIGRSWFAYILDGYSPPKSHLLDANPYPI